MTWLAALVSALGIVLNKWSHAGIKDGDYERRAWARNTGTAVAILGGLAAVASAVAR